MFVHAESVITLLAGQEFAAAAMPLRILSLSAIFAGVSAILRFAATALHQPGQMLKVDIIGVSAAIIAHSILIPPYGIVGAALGKLCGDVVTSTAAVVMLRHQLSPKFLGMGVIAVAATAALVASLSAASYVGLHWMVGSAIATAVIIAVLIFVPPVRQNLKYLGAT